MTPLEEYSPTMHVVGTWGRNSTRAFLVGGPMLLALQYGLGAHRPSADINSYWHPFKDSHGASGDAWIGAISFLTAAKMTDSKLAKVALWSLASVPGVGPHRRRSALSFAGHVGRLASGVVGRGGRHYRPLDEHVHPAHRRPRQLRRDARFQMVIRRADVLLLKTRVCRESGSYCAIGGTVFSR